MSSLTILRLASHFNSIKVRLKLEVGSQFSVTDAEFQFHKGTIKTINPYFALGNIQRFQFHKGTIKTR